MESSQGTTATAVILEMARLGHLPLDQAEAELILPTFTAWAEGAAGINALMSTEEHRELIPVTTFDHPTYGGR